jgi:hypothetical protein
MTMDQQAGQCTDQRLMGHQQELALRVLIELAQGFARITVGRKPGHCIDPPRETQGAAHQRGGLLSPHIRTNQDRTKHAPLQLHRCLANLLTTARGQGALGIAARLNFGLAVAQ